MVLLGVFLLEAQPRRRRLNKRRAQVGRVATSCRAPFERARDELDHLVVLDVAGCRDDDVPWDVHRVVVARDCLAGNRRDHLGRPDHRATERMVTENRVRDQVVDQLLRGVVVHCDLLENDLALGVELRKGRLRTPCRS